MAASVLVFARKGEGQTALVLIDIQAFYFDTTKAPLVVREEASLKAGSSHGH